MGMKQILVMMAAVVLVGQSVVADEKLIADPIVEWEIRKKLSKPEGELTETDLRKLTFLNLALTQITDTGLKDVAKLQQLIGLVLIGTQITDVGLKEVAKLQKLEVLLLNNTKITDAGLKEVAKLQKLEELDLRGSEVTKAGVAEFKRALPNCQIDGP